MVTKIGRAEKTLVDLNDVTASITAPSNPTNGAMWWNQTDSKLYVYSNNAWVLSSNYEAYVQSRGENLVTNGTGLLGNNTNFSGFKFDGSQVFAGAGSFYTDVQNGYITSDELIPVDPSRKYRASYMAKSKLGVGAHYGGFNAHDVDKLLISSAMRIASSYPVVTLAQDLKKGDTVMYLTSTDGFTDTSGNNSHIHSLIMWGYKNSFGYEYPAGTYSRLHFRDAWLNGAINQTAKTITFSKPFSLTNPSDPEGIFRAGHKLSKTTDGGTYLYTMSGNVKYPADRFQLYTGVFDGTGNGDTKFPHGTAFLKFMWLTNRSTDGGTAGDAFWLNNVSLTDITDLKAVDDKVIDITQTLGNMANDNLLDFEDRKVVKDKLTEILGSIQADATTALPTTATLDSGLKGEFYSVRKSALNAGLLATDARYIDVATKYNALKTYLDAMTPVKPWDLRTTTQTSNITVVKDTFRTNWQNYYTSIDTLATATAEKLKKNVDDIVVGGANHIRNGNFGTTLDTHEWTASYVGQTKEIVDVSTEAPPFKFAYHVKNTTNANGGIFQPIIWDGLVAEGLVDKEVTISFWMKYQNITQGVNAYNLGRFAELMIEGTTATGTKVYRYPRITTTNTSTESTYFSGTDMVWKKYTVTHKLSLPATAIKLSRIQFKHGLEGCVGEFWTTGIQAEIGNKASDWKYSDLDMQDKFTKVEFKITDSEMTRIVTSSDTFATKLKTATDAVEVGGRNLMPNSSAEKTVDGLPVEWLLFNGSTALASDEGRDKGGKSAKATVTGTGQGFRTPSYINVVAGKTYMLSGWMKTDATSPTVGWAMKFKDALGVETTPFASSTVVTTPNTWTFVKQEFIAPVGAVEVHTTPRLIAGTVATTAPLSSLWVDDMKLEVGNKATDWSPAPQDIDAEITLMQSTLSSVVEVMSEDGKITTFTETTAFKEAIKDKADAGALTGLVNSEDVKDIIEEEIDVEGSISDFIDTDLLSEDGKLKRQFTTKQELIENTKETIRKFSASGGLNLLKNSIGYADLNGWRLGTGDSAISIVTSRDMVLNNLGFGSGFEFKPTANAKQLYQDVPIVGGKKYTLSWYLNKLNDATGSLFKISVLSVTPAVLDSTGATVTPESTTLTAEYIQTTSTAGAYVDNILEIAPTTNLVRVMISGNGVDSGVITGLMLSMGDVALPWTMATGEMYNTNIRMDITGIRVSQIEGNETTGFKEVGFTHITPTEFAGYYDTDGNGTFEKVFYIQEAETVSKKVRALEEITMGTLKLMRVNEPVAKNIGWALTPIAE